MNNMTIWERNRDIEPAFTKPITGRDFKGTSPDPHKIIEMMTKEFGPVGKGFGWNVLVEDFQPLGEGTVLHWCRIRFWWRQDGNIYEHEAYGQTKAAYIAGKKRDDPNSGYLKTDEDAPKKSMTDALTKAASQLGFAASVYLGLYDDQKYVNGLDAKYRWKDAHEKDSRFWDPVYDALPADPSIQSVCEQAAEHILYKIREYKTVKSVNDYLTKHKERFTFIEMNDGDVFDNLKSDILSHRNFLSGGDETTKNAIEEKAAK